MMGGVMGMGLWMLIGVAAVLAVLVAAVLASIWLLRRLRADRSGTEHAAGAAGDACGLPDSRAVDILRHRYAAGEIDDEEYERRLSTLSWR